MVAWSDIPPDFHVTHVSPPPFDAGSHFDGENIFSTLNDFRYMNTSYKS
jgi:hypothetical protein